MAKKFTVEGEVVEQNKFYTVIKSQNDGKFYIFSKYDDTYYVGDKYKIIGAAVLEDNNGTKYYSNYVNPQQYGQGRVFFDRMEIDSWETKEINGKEQTSLTYFDEKGFKFVRLIDEQGNLYKQKKQTAQEQEEVLSL